MPDCAVTEEPLQFGQAGRLFAILSLPSGSARYAGALPTFVFLTAGLLHRVGPNRLHVRLARELAYSGCSSLRVDLSGTGDSPRRTGLTNQQSVATDFEEILKVIDSRLGRLPLVLAGLCSGADNAIRLAPQEPRVVGMILLDPICYPDHGIAGFEARRLAAKYGNPARYAAWLKRRLERRCLSPTKESTNQTFNPLSIRDLPSLQQQQAAFEAIQGRGGRVLSIFTRYSLRYYNRVGQLGRSLEVNGYEQFCTELFWPSVDHTYSLELHRRRLAHVVKTWAEAGIARTEASLVASASLPAHRGPSLIQPNHESISS